MFEDPNDESAETSLDPSGRAAEKSDELRMHAEIAAVFEGTKKFDARIIPGLDPDIARDVQRKMALLDKAKESGSPVIPEASLADASALLSTPTRGDLSTNDYHVYRRPGEVMIVRWLAGEQVETFYTRVQAHFDAALAGLKEDEHQAHEWKQDPKTLSYLAALDAVQVKMAERYLREIIRTHKVSVLSTQTADEISIAFLAEYVMGVSAAELVGRTSAPPDEPTERDLAWFYKLFSLRGIVEGIERMCFFAYLQKVDDSDDSW